MATPNIKIGEIYFIGPRQDIVGKQSGRTMTKRELYIKVDRRDSDTDEVIRTSYPKFDLTGSRCDILDNFQTGQRVAVYFDIEGEFYESGKDQNGQPMTSHFNRVTAYKVLTIEEYKAQQKRNYTPTQENAAPAPQQSVFDAMNQQQQQQYGQGQQFGQQFGQQGNYAGTQQGGYAGAQPGAFGR